MLKTQKNMPPFSKFCARPLRNKKDTAAAEHLEVVVAERLRWPRGCGGREGAHKPLQYTHDIHFNLRNPGSREKHTPHVTLSAYGNIFFDTDVHFSFSHDLRTRTPRKTRGFSGGPTPSQHTTRSRGKVSKRAGRKHPLRTTLQKTMAFQCFRKQIRRSPDGKIACGQIGSFHFLFS